MIERDAVPPELPGLTAVVVGRGGVKSLPRRLIDRLASAGMVASLVDSLEDARALLQRLLPHQPTCLLLDLEALGYDQVSNLTALRSLVTRASSLAPGLAPVVIANHISTAAVIACFRAGAGDVIDLQVEGVSVGRASFDRVARRQSEYQNLHAGDQASLVADLRDMIEEFLRDLIRTERRSLDLEAQLHHRSRRGTNEFLAAVDSQPARQPTVLLVEDDRAVADILAEQLELAEVTTFAYLTGEDAVNGYSQLLSTGTSFDLALVDLRLPGIDGLTTIRRLRQTQPELPAFLMTGYGDRDAAVHAADLGVVGYVSKPFDDLPELIQRLRSLAIASKNRSREHRYLREIKDRHEHVLQRYRALVSASE